MSEINDQSFKQTNVESEPRIKGSVITTRTGKFTPISGVNCSFNMFYVPHRNSIPPMKEKNPIPKSRDEARYNFIKELVRKKSGSLIEDIDLILPEELSVNYRQDDMRDVPIEGIAKKYSKSPDFLAVSSPLSIPSVHGIIKDVCGTIHNNSVINMRNGCILRAYASRKMSQEFGTEIEKCAFMIRVRSTASYKKVYIELPNYSGRSFPSFFVEGRFDIITLSQAYDMGIKPLGGFALEGIYDPVAFRSMFVVEDMNNEIEQINTVRSIPIINDKGEKIIIKRNKPKKNIG